MMRPLTRRIYNLTLYTLAAVLVTAAVAISLFRIVVPQIPEYRQQVEAWVSSAVERPVTIEDLSARWGLLGPEVRLLDVEIGREGDPAHLVLDEVRVGFSLWDMAVNQRVRPRDIRVAGARIQIRQIPRGRWEVEGLILGEHDRGVLHAWRTAVPVLTSYGRLSLVNSVILLQLQGGGESAQRFEDVNIEVATDGNHHRIEASAGLPGTFGETLRFSLDARGPVASPTEWSGELAVEGSGLRPGRYLRKYVGRSLVLGDSRFDVDLDSEWRSGRPTRVEGTVDARQVGLVDPKGGTAALEHLGGRFVWTAGDGSWRLAGESLRMTVDGRSWPESRFEVTVAGGGPTAGGSLEVAASYLRLEDVVRIALALPVTDSAMLQRLRERRPEGELRDFRARYEPGEGAAGLTLAGHFSELGWRGDEDLPGVRGLTGKLEPAAGGGSLHLDSRDASFRYPQLLAGPLSFDRVSARVDWRATADGWRIDARDWALANDDLALQGRLDMTIPPDGSPTVDLTADVERARVAALPGYLPRRGVPDKARSWLADALVGGRVVSGGIDLHGPLGKFPYADGGGRFRVSLDVEGAVLDYASAWPALEEADARVTFEGDGLEVALRSARISGMQVQPTSVRLHRFREGDLRIESHMTGDNGELIRFLRDSPLGRKSRPFLEGLSGAGPVAVDLQLRLPLGRLAEADVTGSVTWSQARFRHAAWPLDLTRLDGSLSFTRQRFQGSDLQGYLGGRPVTLSVSTGPVGGVPYVRVAASGRMDAEGVRQLAGALPAGVLDGATGYDAEIRIPAPGAPPGHDLELSVRSDLKGLGVDLPGGLGKPADRSRMLDVHGAFPGAALRVYRFDYGDAATGVFRFTRDGGGWSLERGGLALGGGTVELPAARGLAVSGRVGALDVGEVRRIAGRGVGTGGLPAWLASVDLRIGRLTGLGFAMSDVGLELRREPDAWRLSVDSGPVRGSARLPRGSDTTGPWRVDLAELRLGRPGASDAEDAASTEPTDPLRRIDPAVLPPLDLASETFVYKGRDLGSLTAELRPLGDGIRLSSLRLQGATATLEASGTWSRVDASHTSRFEFHVTSDDPPETLERLGFAAPLRAESATLDAHLDWPGTPAGFRLAAASGTLSLRVEEGALLSVEPGAGRIFGLFSLYALPRRLTLDFGDVIGKGLAFDTITGDFVIVDGNAYTSNLTLDGPAAQVKVRGRTGLVARDFDQTVVVTPSLSSSLTLAGTLAGGPTVGAALFIAQELLRRPLGRMTRVRYKLTGSWEDPRMVPVSETPAPSDGNPPTP